MLQNLLVHMLVGVCAAYVGWTLLLPAALRRRLAQALLRRRWPLAVQRRLQAASRRPSVCACDGCDASPTQAAQGSVQTVHWAPRRRR